MHHRTVHLRWEGAFLPNNLIHRLMLRKYEELDQKYMWRTGAYFHLVSDNQFCNGTDNKHLICTALAEMTDDKSMDVYVSGNDEEAQRNYLDSFLEQIGIILRSLNLLETKEYVCCTINGKEGKILYTDLLFAFEHGLQQFQVPDIREFVNPEELLLRTYANMSQGQNAKKIRQWVSSQKKH